MDVHPILVWLGRAAAEATRPRNAAVLLPRPIGTVRDAARR